jgi:dynamin 1-like protein
MDELIPLINRLQDVFSATKQFNNIVNVEGYDNNHSGRSLANMIQLPQIVVVGAQSSGKSSVLESIVGRDFLPRGPGIVTRRPLVLQLVHVPPKVSGEASENESSDKIGEEYGVFLHKKDQFFYNFADIRREISEETNRVSGTNKGVSSKPINLKIYSHRVVDLTLIDLPGIARVPVGDQPTDIEKKIRQLVLEYISNPNSIILAVTAANTDIANSDAIHLAMQVDPSGERTLGVLTKVDLMDKGTNALEILNGNHVPLKLGYVAVINRSQEDVFSNKSIEAALDAESQYFAEHLAYRNISFRCGTPFLTKSLNSVSSNFFCGL